MNFSFLTSLFKKKSKTLALPDSFLIKKIKRLNHSDSLLIYKNITIYHHSKSFFIPLLILDTCRGIYLFEYKKWTYAELKNATVSKATNQNSADETLAFQNAHEFIQTKFNELIHNDGVPIFNFLLMENLNADEHEHLNVSFKELLPKERVMFNDSSKKEIIQKLRDVSPINTNLPDVVNIMGNLLIQYLIIDEKNESIHFATDEQIAFIEHDIDGVSILHARSASGKTSSILLKAILEKIKKPTLKIIIIQATTLACDKLKQRLINSIERAIIELDITSIEIITPIDLMNKHLEKLHKPKLELALFIDEKLMKKSFNEADLILCDDADLYESDFTSYLRHIQKKSSLIIVQNHDESSSNNNYHFTENFRTAGQNIILKKVNQYAKTLQIIAKLLKEHDAKDILIVSDNLNKKRLYEDLEYFIEEKVILLDSNQNLLYQNLDSLILSSYTQISSMESKFVILLDIAISPINEVIYALNLSTDTTYVLYEEESVEIDNIRNEIENN